jgi:hypothetical protein
MGVRSGRPGTPPNPRVQRTRSSPSARHSPLTRHPLGGSLAAVFLVAMLGWSPEKPKPESVETSSGSGMVSPTAVATWIVRREPQRSAELDLLVLWRGSPGWFMRVGSSESSGEVWTGVSGGQNDQGIVFEQLSFGGIRLDLEFDRGARAARVQDQEVSLESANVILVDEVDSATGPQVVSTLRVDPVFGNEPSEIEVIIRRNPELYSFLRCDAKLPDPNEQQMVESICARLKAK